MLLRGELTAQDSAAMIKMLLRANPKKYTGANKLDMLRIQVMHGVFQNNESMVEDAFSEAYTAMKVFPQAGDSFQLDHSFHQHGPQLLPGVYGAVVAADMMTLVGWSAGTPAAIGSASMAVFEGYVLDGLAWFIVGRKGGAVTVTV